MAKLNITQAARQWNVARSTLQRAVKRGDVAVTTDQKGIKSIDSSEMIRVYGEASGRSAVNLGVASYTTDNTEIRHKLELAETHKKYLLSENNLLKTELDKKDVIIANQRDMLTAFFKRLNSPKKS